MKLTREQRSSLFAGEHPRIAYDGDRPCPAKQGDRYTLTPGFWIEVTAVKRSKKGEHVLWYEVFDHRVRPRLVRRTPVIHGEEARDPTKSEIERARLEGSYTSDPTAAVDHLEAVDDRTLKGFTKDARERIEAERQEEIARSEALSLGRQIRQIVMDACRMGVDAKPLLLRIQAEIRKFAEQTDKAA